MDKPYHWTLLAGKHLYKKPPCPFVDERIVFHSVDDGYLFTVLNCICLIIIGAFFPTPLNSSDPQKPYRPEQSFKPILRYSHSKM